VAKRKPAPAPRRTREHVIAAQSHNYVEKFFIDKGHTVWAMKNNRISNEQLHKVLTHLGYAASAPGGNRVVYHHPDSRIDVILPRMRRREVLKPIDLLSVQNALANGGIVPKDEFDSLFHREPLELWHAIKDAEAEYRRKHGRRASKIKLPDKQALDLGKLRRSELGPLAERIMCEGIQVLEEEGLLGVPVTIVHDESEFIFE
jgi:hypothetical protein